jgi:hypothetical protein
MEQVICRNPDPVGDEKNTFFSFPERPETEKTCFFSLPERPGKNPKRRNPCFFNIRHIFPHFAFPVCAKKLSFA